MAEIREILYKYITGEILSVEENAYLEEWTAYSPANKQLFDQFQDTNWRAIQSAKLKTSDTSSIWQLVETELQNRASWNSRREIHISRKAPNRANRSKLVWVVAVAGTIIFFVYKIVPSFRGENPKHTLLAGILGHPGISKAVLTLSNGRSIALDSGTTGILASQANETIEEKVGGEIVYKGNSEKKETEPGYNLLATPRAGYFSLFLSDGTKVWLNNASSIRYPVRFSGSFRDVVLSGEAYFEVSKDVTAPFRVFVQADSNIESSQVIEVLGTSFNVTAFPDDDQEKTTLVEGSVRIIDGKGFDSIDYKSSTQKSLKNRAGKFEVTLKPGEQIQVSVNPNPIKKWAPENGNSYRIIKDADVTEVTAWKNGYFYFDHTSLASTMRQLARWYDIDVFYKGDANKQEFQGRIQRNLPLSDILKGLENDHVHFALTGRILQVTISG